MATDPGLYVERVTTFDEFCALEEHWNQLATYSVTTIFLTFTWLVEWWKVFGEDYKLWILVACRDSDILGILPLMIQVRSGIFRHLLFMGEDDTTPNHLDVIARPEDQQAVLAAFARHITLASAEWDVLDLNKFPGDGSSAAELQTFLQSMNLSSSLEIYTTCPYVVLPDSFDLYLGSRSKSTRRDFRRDKRILKRDFPDSRFGTVQDPEDLDRVLDAMIGFHQARWTGRGYTGTFSSPRLIRFFKDVARHTMQAGMLRLYYLQVGDEIVAVKYDFRLAESMQSYLGGFDPRWSKYGPGNLTLGFAIEQAIVEHAQIYDFLEGNEPHKRRWMTDTRDNVRLRAFAPRFRGVLARTKSGVQEAIVAFAICCVPVRIRRPIYQAWRRWKQRSIS